jgi:transglutaminase-like putative cysteine protease
VSGLGDFSIPASHRQRIETIKGKDAINLEVLRDHRVKKAEPLKKEQIARYTRSTPRIQCDHEAIREQAKKIVGDEMDPLKAVKLLEAWVYKTLEKSYRDNADTALQILDQKAGDCTEHSLLFVALARSLGIPAREVGGVAYVKVSKPLFGWHAWAEIHDGHQWVSIDPTWNEVYVDGTHIKLSEGSDDMAWANVAGKMKVKVVKVERRK